MKPPPKRHSVGGKLLIETVKHAERGETPDETASWKLPTLQYPTAKGSGLPSTAMHTTVLRRRAGRPSSWWLKKDTFEYRNDNARGHEGGSFHDSLADIGVRVNRGDDGRSFPESKD